MKLSCIFGHKWLGCTCAKCGEVRGEGHHYANYKDQNGKCVGRCKCGKTETLEHNFENVSGNLCPVECSRCGNRKYTHDFQPVPGKCYEQCSVCGWKKEFPHTWQTVLNKCGQVCAVCGEEADVSDDMHTWQRVTGECKEKCIVCGIERNVDHTWQQVQGKCEEKCVVCGHTQVAHDYVYEQRCRCGKLFDKLNLPAIMDESVQKLLAIFPSTPLDYEGHKRFDAAHRNEVREIGEMLNKLDGMWAMRNVGEAFARQLPIHARKLDTTWDGIGYWRG